MIFTQLSVFVIEGGWGCFKGDAMFRFVLLGFASVPFKNDVGHTLILTVQLHRRGYEYWLCEAIAARRFS